MTRPFRSMDTALVHAGEPRPRHSGAVVMPIYQSATFEYSGDEGYHDLRYIRLNNTPSQQALAAKLAALENAEAALPTASGMAAISSTLLTVLRPGDHLLAHTTLYGGTHDFVTGDLVRLGIEHTFVDACDPSSWAGALRRKTRGFYVETLTNPLLQLADLDAVARFSKEHGLVSLIDNTLTTPLGFRPIDHGFTFSLHSGTKYLNGHSDIVCGVVVGSAEHVERVRHTLNHLGGSLDPHACFLLHRGLKTLGVRFRAQCVTATALAAFLSKHPRVARVNYPGLPSHPHHARAKTLLDYCGGLLSFEPKGGAAAAERFLGRLRLAVLAPSLGGPETLVVVPAKTSHAGMSVEDRRRAGIGDGLVRVSVGLEGAEDLIEDFDQALGAEAAVTSPTRSRDTARTSRTRTRVAPEPAAGTDLRGRRARGRLRSRTTPVRSSR